MSPAKIKIKARAQKRREPGTMSLTESRYAAELESRLKAGTIDRYDYEPESLKLAKKCAYTPDFRVVENDGTVVMIEVKPHGWRNIPNQANSSTKIKVAARLHPYVFVRATERAKRDGGGFAVEVIEGE